VDNGILFAVATQDRRARIEVGYGLEGAVPDVIAKRILEDVVFDRFRAGDFEGGIEAGVDRLIAAARGEVVELPPAREGAPHEDPLAAVLFAVFFGTMFTTPLRRVRPLGAIAGGLLGGVIAWMSTASVRWSGLAFALAFLLGWILPAAIGGGRPGRFGRGGGGFGGRGGGGGFGGGGGRFGGGGASGRW
jgi:uncharacterized protein